MFFHAGEFEKELNQQDNEASLDAMTSDFNQDAATSDSDQSLVPSTSFPRSTSDTVDVNAFIQQFMEKNYGMS